MTDEPTSGSANDPSDIPTEPVAVPADPAPADPAPVDPAAAAGTEGPPPWQPASEPTGATTAAAPVAVAAPAGSEPPKRSGVMVPVWALVTVAGLLIFGLGLLGGWAIASNNDDHNEAFSPRDLRELAPFGGQNSIPGNGSGSDTWDRGNGNGDDSGSSANATVYLGVVPSDSTDPAGAEIEEVADASPAEKAGLEEDDVITAVDGDAVGDASELAQRIRALDSGDKVKITYTRDGDSKSVEVTLADRPAMSQLPLPDETPQSAQ